MRKNSKWFAPEIRKECIDKIANAYSFEKYEDWYRLTRKMVIDQGLAEFIKAYGQSPFNLVKNNFPDYDWKPWLFANQIRNFWGNDKYFLDFFKWVEKKLNIKTLEDWYNITDKEIKKLGFYKSLFESLVKIYPNYDWKPWLFKNPPKNLWNNFDNRKQYFLWLSKELQIKYFEDWYKVTAYELQKYHYAGGMLNRHYNSSIINFISENIPEYDWKPWKFVSVSNKYWKNKSNHRLYGKWMENILNIDQSEKWYLVTQEDFYKNCGASILSVYYGGSPEKFVSAVFPEYNLDITKFKNKRKSQGFLFNMIKKIFPNNKVLWDHRHNEIRSKHNRKLELDIFIPELNLAFEYQGEQHYRKAGFFGKRFESLQENDKLKSIRCKELGITLIEILWDWSKTEEELIDILKNNNINVKGL